MAPPGKIKAVVSYLTFVGLLIAITMNKDEHHDFALWHIKNMFGLCLIFFISFVMSYQEHLLIIGSVLFYGSILFWIYSFAMAIANRTSGIPFFSDKFQKWFTFLN